MSHLSLAPKVSDQRSTSPSACRVPWEIQREFAPSYGLTNRSPDTLNGVSLTLLGSGVMTATPPQAIGPGQTLRVVIRGHNLAVNSILVVRWFQPDGLEYLWRVSF